MFAYTGDYKEQIATDDLQSKYYTFTPRPLMDGGFFTLNNELVALLSDTYYALGVLEGLSHSASSQDALEDLLRFKEGYYNKLIDYTAADFKAALLNRSTDALGIELANIISTYRLASTNFDEIAGCALNKRMGVRNNQVFLVKSISNYRQYNPTAPSEIRVALHDLSRFSEAVGHDPLIKAALCHYQFEMIHPYEAYNGVIGRVLIYQILRNAGFDTAKYLCLSESLYHHKDEYFDMLGRTQKSGDYYAWISFFVSIVREAAQNSIRFFMRYMDIAIRDETLLAGNKDKKQYTEQIYEFFRRNVISSIGSISGCQRR